MSDFPIQTTVFRPPTFKSNDLSSFPTPSLDLTPKQQFTPSHRKPELSSPTGRENSLKETQELTRLQRVQMERVTQTRQRLRNGEFIEVPEEGTFGAFGQPARIEARTNSDPSLGVPSNPSSTPRRVISSSSASKTGVKDGHPKLHNQDSFLVCQLDIFNQQPHLLIVSDGHGSSGHTVSAYVTTYLPCFFLEVMETNHLDENAISEGLLEGFKMTNQSMRKCAFDAVCSGATCVAAVISDRHVVCANVGDSRAVLGRAVREGVSAAIVTKDHKPEVESEKKRIVAAGGRVAPIYTSNGQTVGPLRVWFQQDNTLGLAMTRTMGNFLASDIGIISIPGID